MIPYLLLAGLTCIVVSGLWVVAKYEEYSVYPREIYKYLIIGICLITIAFLMTQLKNKKITHDVIAPSLPNKKDNREFINKLWKNKMKIGDRVVGFFLVTLALIAIFNLGFAVNLLAPIFLSGTIIFGFVFIMHDDEDDDVWDPPKSRFMQILLRLIDYRTQPFSVPLILFILIVVSFLLSKQFEFTLSLETGGNPRYVISLPALMFTQAALVFICGFIYIIQHGDFLGIRQAKQSDTKKFTIHFAVIGSSSPTFLIWLMTLF